MAAALRERMYAVSRIDSPRLSWSSPRAQHHRVTAHLGDAGLERCPRARRRRLEDERHRAAHQRVGAQRRGLELGGAIEQGVELRGAELGPGEEVAWHGPQCTLGRVHLRVLTWNLKHGRSVPPSPARAARRVRRGAAGLGVGRRAAAGGAAVVDRAAAPTRVGAEHRQALTSRNALPRLRRALARRWPEVMKSQGGGANAILARRDRIVAHHVELLTRTPGAPRRARGVAGVRRVGGQPARHRARRGGGASATEPPPRRRRCGGRAATPSCSAGTSTCARRSGRVRPRGRARRRSPLHRRGDGGLAATPRCWTAARCLTTRRWRPTCASPSAKAGDAPDV